MKQITLLVVVGLLSVAIGHAQTTAYSPPVGGVAINAAANTDNIISIPLPRNVAWVGSALSGSGSNITANGTPGWTSNAFASASLHYVRVLSGVLQGHYFVITGNSSDTLTVDPAGLNLSSMVNGDRIEIAPFWTLGTLFPAVNAGSSFIASASSLARQTELLLYDATSTGINRSANAIFYFYNGAWRKAGSSVATSFDNTVLFPDAFFVQRNKAAATKLIVVGRVQQSSLSTVLEAIVGGENDNFAAVSFPVALTLNQTGLATSGFTASTSALSVKDQLLWFDPAGTGTNRSATAIYYYYNGGWRKKGASVALEFGSSVVIPAGSGFIVRKAANGVTAPWVFNPRI